MARDSQHDNEDVEEEKGAAGMNQCKVIFNAGSSDLLQDHHRIYCGILHLL